MTQATDKIWTVLGILEWTRTFFADKSIDSPRLDAELLLGMVLGLDRIHLYVEYQRPLSQEERDAYRALVKRRAAGEPVQYIVGEQEFWSLPFKVGPGILVPRPDTEVLIEEALKEAKRLRATGNDVGADVDGDVGADINTSVGADVGPDVAAEGLMIADIGTGSGAIAIALATELKGATVVAGDIAPEPVEFATANAAANGVADRVKVMSANGLLPLWEANGRRPFDLICSNPPYIRAGDHAGLMREVRDWEPKGALVSGEDGLDLIRRLVKEVRRPGVLADRGAVLFEIGDRDQAERLAKALDARGFTSRIRDDYGGRARVVVGVRQSE